MDKGVAVPVARGGMLCACVLRGGSASLRYTAIS